MAKPNLQIINNQIILSIPFETKDGKYIWQNQTLQVRLYTLPGLLLGKFEPLATIGNTQVAYGDSLQVSGQIGLSPLSLLFKMLGLNFGVQYGDSREKAYSIFQYQGRTESEGQIYYSFTVEMKHLQSRAINDTQFQDFVWDILDDHWEAKSNTFRIEVGSLNRKNQFSPLIQPVPFSVDNLISRANNQNPADEIIHLISAIKLKHPDDVPNQVFRFFGREAELTELANATRENQTVLIQGFSGCGKTSLLSEHIYKQLESDNTQTVLWFQAGNSSINEWIPAFYRALDENTMTAAIQTDTNKLISDFIKILRKHVVKIIVIDDVWNGEALSILSNALPKSIRVIATSRERFPLDKIIDLSDLDDNSARKLLYSHAMHIDIKSDPYVDKLCALLENNAFAIEIAGKTLNSHSWSPNQLFERIQSTPHELELPLSFGHENRRNIISLINASLEVLPPELKLQFLLLGIFPQPIFHPALIALLPIEIAPDELSHNATLDSTQDTYLIDYIKDTKYWISDKLDPVIKKVKDDLEILFLNGLIQRNRDSNIYYMHALAFSYARSQLKLTVSAEETVIRTVWKFVARHSIPSSENMDLLENFVPLILITVRRAFDLQLFALVIGISHNIYNGYWSNGHILSLRGYFSEALEIADLALEASRKTNNKGWEDAWLGNLASIYRNLREYDKALYYGDLAIEISRAINDKQNLGRQLNIKADILTYQEKYQEARECYQESLLIKQNIKDTQGLIVAYNNLGILYDKQGFKLLALSSYFRAIEIQDSELDNESTWNAMFWSNLGAAYLNFGFFTEAQATLEQALEIGINSGNEQAQHHTYQYLVILSKHNKDRTKYNYYRTKFNELTAKLYPNLQQPTIVDLIDEEENTLQVDDYNTSVFLINEFGKINTISEMLEFALFCPPLIMTSFGDIEKILSQDTHDSSLKTRLMSSYSQQSINSLLERLYSIREIQRLLLLLSIKPEQILSLGKLILTWKSTTTWVEAGDYLVQHENQMCTNDGIIMMQIYGTNDPTNQNPMQKLHLYLLEEGKKVGAKKAYKGFIRLRENTTKWMQSFVNLNNSKVFFKKHLNTSDIEIMKLFFDEFKTLPFPSASLPRILEIHLRILNYIEIYGLNAAYERIKTEIS